MKKRILAMVMALTVSASLAACGGTNSTAESGSAASESSKEPAVSSADAIHLTLGHTGNTEHHYQTMSEDFKTIVEEKTGGSIVIDIFPAEQLGSGVEMLEFVQAGTQDMVIDPDAYLANYDPLFNVIGLPYQFSDWDQFKTFVNSDVTDVLEAAAEKNGFKILGWAANGMRVFTTNEPINGPEDLSGLKIRTASARVNSDMVTTLGAQPTTLSMNEIYSGIQTGMIDGQENPTANIISNKLYEVQKYIAVTHHQTVSEPLIMNLAKFNGLTEEQQQILLDAAKEVCDADIEAVAASEEDDLAYLEDQGCTVTRPDPTPFKEILTPLIQTYCDEYGGEFAELYQQIQEVLQ